MRGYSYHERDYPFGQIMLAVRTRIGLTQAGLAKTLGVSRTAVGDWERGSSHPRAEHLKQFIALAIQHRAFPAGRVTEEVHAVWQRARQKAPLDEMWLATLLTQLEASQSLQPVTLTIAAAAPAYRWDWNGAPAVPTFYSRERGMDLLTGWAAAERYRVVGVLGLGETGKSVLAVSFMHRLADYFGVMIWRSLPRASQAGECA
jgi:transcriptional regulator with XRE-family HTH domain